MHGKWETNKEKYLQVDRFVEKPTISYAEENLGVKVKEGTDHYYSVFGQYILTPEVYAQLKENIDSATDMSKEIELTSAIEAVRPSTGLVGVVLDGKMFDMGKPDAFQDCVANYSK
jgi:UTP-glucose-1-phosphate uridylyltransferase